MNDVCNEVIYFDHHKKKLKYYKGNYDAFEKLRADEIALRSHEIENADKKKAHVQKFIDRFRYNAARASLVQSRIKQMSKMVRE